MGLQLPGQVPTLSLVLHTCKNHYLWLMRALLMVSLLLGFVR